jgi:DNA-binding NarL/FixJ family response regulator
VKTLLIRSNTKLVAVADATPTYLVGLVSTLTSDGVDVIEASSTSSVIDLIGKAPDVLVLDARLLRDDLSLCRVARENQVGVVLTVSKEPLDDLVNQAWEGIVGLWDREGEPHELKRIVAGAFGGESLVSPEVGAALLDRIAQASDSARATVGRLTAREREILSLMADGAGNRAIAEALFISENTVRNHVRNVLDKLQASTRTEAVVRALRAGLVRLG